MSKENVELVQRAFGEFGLSYDGFQHAYRAGVVARRRV
jgi:hypothetical protein